MLKHKEATKTVNGNILNASSSKVDVHVVFVIYFFTVYYLLSQSCSVLYARVTTIYVPLHIFVIFLLLYIYIFFSFSHHHHHHLMDQLHLVK